MTDVSDATPSNGTAPAQSTSPQADIQVDMFEVQLGSAILLQFKQVAGRPVRVLADGGVRASGYQVTHVLNKLQTAFNDFGQSERYLDLVVGTHYDADHLCGLVPIIQDKDIEIGEAWMPPVANDSGESPSDVEVGEADLLGQQMMEAYQENADRGLTSSHVLDDYLESKASICQSCESLEAQLVEGGEELTRERSQSYEWTAGMSREQKLAYFKAHLQAAAAAMGERESCHANDPQLDGDQISSMQERILNARHDFYYWHGNKSRIEEYLSDYLRFVGLGMSLSSAQYNLAGIRKGAASDAINATSLDAVVGALVKRGIPIRFEAITAGEPKRFIWDAINRRFQKNASGKGALKITLLGPSTTLIKKHRDRLPIAIYQAFALMQVMRIKSITPSNQLSYVLKFQTKANSILVTGDAGLVDAKKPPKTGKGYYFRKILDELSSLDVVQVAHHAGSSAHFYRVLIHADIANQKRQLNLLLSHETHDKHRPSTEFDNFVSIVRGDHDNLRILFTSEPEKQKVLHFVDLIGICVSKHAKVGDIQMQLVCGSWCLKKHAIKV